MKTKNEFYEWLRGNAACGNSCWVAINGGGLLLCQPDEVENLISIIMGEDYGDEITMLGKGEEYEDFAASMSADEYDGTDYFIKVSHLTGYGQENKDIQVQYWM